MNSKLILKSLEKNIEIYYSLPKEIDRKTKLLIVMTGHFRNAQVYIENWSQISKKTNTVVIIPKFTIKSFDTFKYNYGNVVTKKEMLLNSESVWTFNYIDEIFKFVKKELNLNIMSYILYGHSAGSQFAHRFYFLNKSKYLDYVIGANAGCYTFLNSEFYYPFGIKNLLKYKRRILKNLDKRIYILIGEKDNDPNEEDFPKEKEFNYEGLHRLERAYNFCENIKNFAKENKKQANIKLIEMKNVAHNNIKTIPFVIKILKNND